MNEYSYTKKSLNNAKYLRKNMTDCEAKLWYFLRAKRFLGLKFKRQVPIGNYIVDFLCPELSLIIELDGSQHLENIDYDIERTNYLESLGFKVLRIMDNEFSDIESVLEYIRQNCEPSP